jgi:hypothetical protein
MDRAKEFDSKQSPDMAFLLSEPNPGSDFATRESGPGQADLNGK